MGIEPPPLLLVLTPPPAAAFCRLFPPLTGTRKGDGLLPVSIQESLQEFSRETSGGPTCTAPGVADDHGKLVKVG